MIFSEIIHSVPARWPSLEADRVAGRKRHVVPVQDAEAQVDLRADARVVLAQRRVRRVRPQRGGEYRGRSQVRWKPGVPADSKTTGGTFHSTISRTKLSPLTSSIPNPGNE